MNRWSFVPKSVGINGPETLVIKSIHSWDWLEGEPSSPNWCCCISNSPSWEAAVPTVSVTTSESSPVCLCVCVTQATRGKKTTTLSRCDGSSLGVETASWWSILNADEQLVSDCGEALNVINILYLSCSLILPQAAIGAGYQRSIASRDLSCFATSHKCDQTVCLSQGGGKCYQKYQNCPSFQQARRQQCDGIKKLLPRPATWQMWWSTWQCIK